MITLGSQTIKFSELDIKFDKDFFKGQIFEIEPLEYDKEFDLYIKDFFYFLFEEIDIELTEKWI